MSKNSANIYLTQFNYTKNYCQMILGDEEVEPTFMGLVMKIVTNLSPELSDHKCPFKGVIGPQNLSISNAFLDGFDKEIFTSKDIRFDIGFFTKEMDPIFTAKFDVILAKETVVGWFLLNF